MNGYLLNNILLNPVILRSQDIFQITLSGQSDYLATRVSYALDLRGPSMTVQTACSSALVGIHLACQGLRNHECDMALAGGVSLRIPQTEGHTYQEGGILSPDGHTRTFDARGGGTTFTSGAAIVVLKRLADAQADGDTIRAVVKGSAVNNDGASKAGYTAPSLDGQVDVIQKALEAAEVGPGTITYVEAHGTATPTGDPVEVEALTKAFRAGTDKKGYCAIGTAKTNVGHLNAAAGAAGVIKTVLSLEHRQLPASLHFENPNPAIDFPASPFYVNRTLSEWTSPDGPRRAAIAALGIGGTNAYVILEQAPPPSPSGPSREGQLLALSAKTPSALEAASGNLASHLEQHPDADLADVCYTLQVGRRAFRHRKVMACNSTAEAVDALRGRLAGRVFTGHVEPEQRPITFLLPGQGSEHVHMAAGLYRYEPDFRETVDRCAELLKPLLGRDVRDVLYPPAGQEEAAAQELSRPRTGQPAVFMISYALAQLWMKWGIQPEAVTGYSTGEIAAACVAGVLSLDDALRIVAERGRLIDDLPEGAMLAVALSEQSLAEHIEEGLFLAAVSGPDHCVVSGMPERISALQEKLRGLRVACRRLPVRRAYHSDVLDSILPEFQEVVAQAELSPAKLPFISALTGKRETEAPADPAYWVRQTREALRFAEALETVTGETDGILIEVGPGQALTDLVRRNGSAARSVVIPTCPDERASQSDTESLFQALGKLWLLGAPVDWEAYHARQQRRRVPLPTYPFERRRYWIEPQAGFGGALSGSASLSKKPDIADWFYVPSWKRLPLESGRAEEAPSQRGPWLLFVDALGLGADLADRLKQAGCDVTTVMAGDRFERTGEGAYVVSPRQAEDYAALIRHLAADKCLPERIVHLWSLAPDDPAAPNVERFRRAKDLGYYSLLSIVWELAKQNVVLPVQIQLVSAGAHAVVGGEVLRPENAAMLGLCGVIPKEYPHLSCRSIDVEALDPEALRESGLGESLFEEVTSAASDLTVAYRNSCRWVQTFEPVRIGPQDARSSLLRENGTYLITGGLGGIGLHLAEHIARTVGGRLILTSRSGLPARDDWADWLSKYGAEDRTNRRIRKVQELEQLGAEVMILVANVADEQRMREGIDRACERFGAIHGVFHGAGILSEEAFTDIPAMDRRTSEMQFEPKVRGLYVLESVLRGREPDFTVLLSSIASIVGGVRYSAYSAANAFLDAFAQQHDRAEGPRWISVNWDSWRLPNVESSGRESLLESAIEPSEGVEAFHRILCTRGMSQVIVSTIDLQERVQAWILPTAEGGNVEAGEAGLVELHPRPGTLGEYAPPADETQEAIAAIWREMLGVEQVGIHDSFFELGGHSLLATRVISRLRRVLGVGLRVGVMFETPTVAGLAERIRGLPSEDASDAQAKLLEEIEDLSEEEARRILMEDKGQDDATPPSTSR